jgi:hypothetical protein
MENQVRKKAGDAVHIENADQAVERIVRNWKTVEAGGRPGYRVVPDRAAFSVRSVVVI